MALKLKKRPPPTFFSEILWFSLTGPKLKFFNNDWNSLNLLSITHISPINHLKYFRIWDTTLGVTAIIVGLVRFQSYSQNGHSCLYSSWYRLKSREDHHFPSGATQGLGSSHKNHRQGRIRVSDMVLWVPPSHLIENSKLVSSGHFTVYVEWYLPMYMKIEKSNILEILNRARR